MTQKRYFQTYLQRKTLETYCNVLILFYKGIPVSELYIDDIDPAVLNMSPSSRKAWAWKQYGFLVGDMRPDVLEDDSYYPPKILSRKELKYELELD